MLKKSGANIAENYMNNILTIKDVRDLLNNGESDEVIKELQSWHPSVLARLLIATYRAYHKRTNYHPDFVRALNQITKP